MMVVNFVLDSGELQQICGTRLTGLYIICGFSHLSPSTVRTRIESHKKEYGGLSAWFTLGGRRLGSHYRPYCATWPSTNPLFVKSVDYLNYPKTTRNSDARHSSLPFASLFVSLVICDTTAKTAISSLTGRTTT
jgi:hypothetical protein